MADAIVNRISWGRPKITPSVLACVEGRIGLEIGGPSSLFNARGPLPVYAHAARIDNVNFATETAWEYGLRDGGAFVFAPGKPPGRQFLREATLLTEVADEFYDIVLSSHCLEHVANPLAALREWHRIARPGAYLLLTLPDPTRTFDHRRPVTTFQHLQDDFRRATAEDDLTHLKEILALHDLLRDVPAGSPAQFRTRSLQNAKNRCLHHHVFSLALIRAALAETGWLVEQQERARPLHLLTLARKGPTIRFPEAIQPAPSDPGQE